MKFLLAALATAPLACSQQPNRSTSALIRQDLQDACVDTTFEVMHVSQEMTIVKCKGHWSPWQSMPTSFPLAETLRQHKVRHGGVYPEAEHPPYRQWESAVGDQQDRLIYGILSRDGHTYVIRKNQPAS